jgi:hypothetical protein
MLLLPRSQQPLAHAILRCNAAMQLHGRQDTAATVLIQACVLPGLCRRLYCSTPPRWWQWHVQGICKALYHYVCRVWRLPMCLPFVACTCDSLLPLAHVSACCRLQDNVYEVLQGGLAKPSVEILFRNEPSSTISTVVTVLLLLAGQCVRAAEGGVHPG